MRMHIEKRKLLFEITLITVIILSVFFGLVCVAGFVLEIVFDGRCAREKLVAAIVLLGVGIGLSLTFQIREAMRDLEQSVRARHEDGH